MVKKLRVTGYTLQFMISASTGTLETIVLILEVDNNPNKNLRLYNIPPEIAFELEKYSNGSQGLSGVATDFRYSIFEVFMELPGIESVLRDSIEEIVIDRLHKENNVFSAEVKLKLNYTGAPKRIRMVPSHAVLLSVLGNIPLYVSEDLLNLENELTQGSLDGDELMDDPDFDLDEFEESWLDFDDDEDEFDDEEF